MTRGTGSEFVDGMVEALESDATQLPRCLRSIYLAPPRSGIGFSNARHVQEPASILYRAPTGIGIEFAYCGCGGRCRRPQVLLEQHTILVDDERHYSGVTVFGRIGDEGESANHLSIDHVILCAAGCMNALPGQHVEVVAMKSRV
jgi:hypothetical protein